MLDPLDEFDELRKQGFEVWDNKDRNYPIKKELKVLGMPKYHNITACVEIKDIVFPTAIPHEKTILAHSAGIKNGWKFVIVIASERKAGKVKNRLILYVQHIMFFIEHGETDSGEVIRLEINPVELRIGQTKSVINAKHGPSHFDIAEFECTLNFDGTVYISLTGVHKMFSDTGESDKPSGITPKEGENPSDKGPNIHGEKVETPGEGTKEKTIEPNEPEEDDTGPIGSVIDSPIKTNLKSKHVNLSRKHKHDIG